MLTLKCKSCGGTIPVDSKESFVTCPYCGNIYDVPMDEKKEQYLNLYSRADDAWDHKDFEEAAELYQQILNIDNTQSEAHFGLVLCKYGITYEIDPVTQKKMPTCNRINRDSILDDKHFLAAVKYGAKDAADSFRSRAQEIDRISRDFLKIVDKEPPYDVFISYKRTAADGSVTQDSKVGRKLYYHLKDKGFKVFFAEETLKTVAGEKYEPYIFAALSSAPVMILMGSCRDHFEATWVKNEWRRYLVLMNQGLKKTLIPAYFDMDPYHMPGELRSLQAMNAIDYTFHEDITEIVRKKVADAKSDGDTNEVKGVSLRDKYAPKDKVEKLLGLTDCDREFAINVLIQCHGDLKQSQKFIEEDPEYIKSVWTCAECGMKNTHNMCRNCGVSKKESLEVARRRKDMEERRRKQSAEYKSKKAQKVKNFFSSLVSILVVCAILGGIGAFGYFVVYKKAIYPNLEVKELNTPEIVQVYSGTYDAGSKDGTAIITILSCDDSGNLTGTFEFFVEATYGKYNVTGHINSKKNNGDVELVLTAGDWIIEADGFNPIDRMDVTISDDYQNFRCSSLSINWSVGGNDEYNVKTAEDLKKLANSGNTFMLVNDIDLEGAQWTPIEGFSGMLLGNGFTIKNVSIESSASNVGFFSVLEGVVQNVNFENVQINVTNRNENVGILCGSLSGGAMKINVSGNVSAEMSSNVGGVIGSVKTNADTYSVSGIASSATVSGSDNVGGIVGYYSNSHSYSSNNFVQLSNGGSVTALGSYAGGVLGLFDGDYTYIKMGDCTNAGDVTGKTYVGGICGATISYRSDEDSYIKNCTSSASITGEAYVGGIVGSASTVVDSCSNEGSSISATKYEVTDGNKNVYLGGYVGKGLAVSNCLNEVEINYTAGGRYVGGIAGYIEYSSDTLAIVNNENKANISGFDYVGGIVGYVSDSGSYDTIQLTALNNSGAIVASGDYAGGIYGYCGGEYVYVLINECNNTGDVSGKMYVGGIGGGAMGYCNSSTDPGSCMSNCTSSASISGEAYVGGIAGFAMLAVDGCSNAGSSISATGYEVVDGSKNVYLGGYVGNGWVVNNCVNEVNINYTAGGRYVGGVIGYCNSKNDPFVMENVENKASIIGCDYVGGVAGYIFYTDNYSTYQLTAFVNSGSVYGNGQYIGGLVGYAGGKYITVLVTDFYNSGNVYGESSYVGGLFGYLAGNDDKSSVVDSKSTGTAYGASDFGPLVGYSDGIEV